MEILSNSTILLKFARKRTDMAILLVDVADESLVAKVKQICKMLQGVTSVKVARPSSHTKDITKTAGYREAMEDIKEGRVYKAASTDDMFKQILG